MKKIHETAEASNQKLWDEIAPVHLKGYKSVAVLESGGSCLDEIELAEIGDVKGKSLLHLQCHIGTDTLSWAREGAKVTGIDFSERSIACARRLQEKLGLEARFIHANIYELPQKLAEHFDIVYTSRGVLCWLRNLEQWGRIVAGFLKPGGLFYLMESHPFIMIFDDEKKGELRIAHPYFHREEPTLWDGEYPDYADDSYFPQNPSYEWTWSLSDIFTALLDAGLTIELFREYDRIFHKHFPDMEPCADGWYDLPRYKDKLPLIFTLRARKPVDA